MRTHGYKPMQVGNTTASDRPTAGTTLWNLGIMLLLTLLALVLVRTAWMSDDAYITLRTVDNFVHGYGLTWNPGERVQAYTHPLWMLLLAASYAASHEPYYTTLLLSMVLTMAAAATLALLAARGRENGVIVLAILISSKSFIDYGTGGLENPLAYFLVALFALLWYRAPGWARHPFWLSFMAALVALTRLDLLLLLLPALLWALWRGRSWAQAGWMVLGQFPLVAWEIFSLVYYGFIFPNTAYAKLVTAYLGRLEVVTQGLFYVLSLVSLDLLTAAILAVSLVLPFWRQHRHSAPFAIGIGCYLLYILAIGGDFMAGRYFAVPLVMAASIIGDIDLHSQPPALIVGIAALILGLGFLTPVPNLLSGPDAGYPPDLMAQSVDVRGIADERRAYYVHTGLLRRGRDNPVPIDLWWERIGTALRSDATPVRIEKNIGFVGYYAGPQTHIIDPYGLSEPLLARLPPIRQLEWRPGHWARLVPEGYVETVQTGVTQLEDRDLGAYYDQLRLTIRGDLFDPARWQAIWQLNTGQLDYLLHRDAYRHPDMVHLSLDTLAPAAGASERYPMLDSGLAVTMEQTVQFPALALVLDPHNDYTVVYRRDGVSLVSQQVAAWRAEWPTVRYIVPTPTAAQAGFDEIWLLPDSARGERYVVSVAPTTE